MTAPRELEIVSAVVAGYSNKEIAEYFKISGRASRQQYFRQGGTECPGLHSMTLPRVIPQRINELPDFVALAVNLLCGFLRQLAMDPQLLF
jgi:hypothetical protein